MDYQIYYSKGMEFFGLNAERHFGFKRYDIDEQKAVPVLFSGLYNAYDYTVFKTHLGRKAIFWHGSDVRILAENPSFQAIVSAFPRTIHACHNQELADELALLGIKAVVQPLFFNNLDYFQPQFKRQLYYSFYSVAHDGREAEYGVPVIEAVAAELPTFTFHIYGIKKENTKNIFYHGVVDEAVMDMEIREMHGCIRLNEHDGFSQTVMKSLLLGHYPCSAVPIAEVPVVKTKEQLKMHLISVAGMHDHNIEASYYWRKRLNKFDWLELPKNSLGLVMIVKNEEKGLENAILSCRDFVDYFCISVDKASTDKTLEIASKYADLLKEHEWQDNFSACRNEAQKGVPTDWILFLDGHEFVESVGDIRAALAQDCDGLAVRVVMENGFSFYYPRIYRNGLQFEGAVHNMIECKNVKPFHDFIIKHDRNNLQAPEAVSIRKAQRDDMMPRLLRERIAKNKKDARALFYLAVHVAGEQKFKEAIKLYKKYLKYSDNVGEQYVACMNVASCLNNLGKHLQALGWLDKAEKLNVGRWETSLARSATYMFFGRWERASIFAVDCLKNNDCIFAFNPIEKRRDEIWDMIGICFFNLKNYAKAIASWKRGLEVSKNPKKIEEFSQKISVTLSIIEVEVSKSQK